MWARGLGVVAPGGLPGLAGPERPWDWGWHPMWGPWGMWGAWGLAMMLLMVLFWGLVLVALVLGIRWLWTQGRAPQRDTALEILRERYARGELTREEFEARRRDLEA